MNSRTSRRMDMGERVRGFVRAHPTVTLEESVALHHLEQLLDRGTEQAVRQRQEILAERGATLALWKLRRLIQGTLVRYLASVGTVAAREKTELGMEFRRLNKAMTHLDFVSAVRGILARATAEQEVLIRAGLSPALVDDLGVALRDLEAALESSRAARQGHVGASAVLREIGKLVVEQVRVLDGLVRYRYGGEPELMGAWASARTVFGSTRPVHRAAEEVRGP